MSSLERVLNAQVGLLVRAGVPLFGAQWLEVCGRKSGQWRGTVVNPLTFDGELFLVAPRGETQWVKNLRAAGACRLRGADHRATEVAVAERAPLHAAYLKRWGWQVGTWMKPDADPAAHPVFRLEKS